MQRAAQKAALLLAPKPAAEPTSTDLGDIEDVKQKMRWRSDATVYDWIKHRGFPKPLKGSRRCARWIMAEIDKFVSGLPRGASGGNPVQRRAG